jgi:quercetin dioxygenase-like cupin family protein
MASNKETAMPPKRGQSMKVYRWDSYERRFLAARMHDSTAPGERVMLMTLQVKKGDRVSSAGLPDERMICLLRGSWRMNVADHELMVRRSEAIVIPSGFGHSAEAVEDSFALQLVREPEQADDGYLWGV